MIYVIGIGSGNLNHMTLEALEAIKKSEVIVGYKNYLKFIKDLIQHKEQYENGMRGEVERINKAVQFAQQGKITAVISSGDAGIYGMAGLVYQMAEKMEYKGPIQVIPGISAFTLGAAVLGAPIMHDNVLISLSDLLTDWDLIQKRIEYGAKGDFIISIYNPKSKGRTEQIQKAQEIMLQYKDKQTPVGIVKHAGRENESYVITSLEKFLDEDIDMSSIVIVGNSETYVWNGRMITPRGYTP